MLFKKLNFFDLKISIKNRKSIIIIDKFKIPDPRKMMIGSNEIIKKEDVSKILFL
mgnify:CR=1 FL=1